MTGRLQVSRFDINEATVLINGVHNDVLIRGKQMLNRGLSMDTVIVQILPESQWLDKSNTTTEAIVTDILEKDQEKVQPSELDNDVNKLDISVSLQIITMIIEIK